MATKLTGPGREKILRQMIEVFKKHYVYSNITIFCNGRRIRVGDLDIIIEDDDTKEDGVNIKYTEPKLHVEFDKKASNWGGNDKTITVQYDGGPFYSMWSGEFGWSTRKKIEEELEPILGPYHLGIEEIDHVSFTLIEDVKPDYERVMDKLSGKSY